MFCCTLLYVHSSIAIILMGKRELITLLNLSSWCLLMVERLFLVVPRGCLQFVIVVLSDHTHLLFFHSCRLKDAATAENVMVVHTLIMSDRRPDKRSIASKIGIRFGTIRSILTDILGRFPQSNDVIYTCDNVSCHFCLPTQKLEDRGTKTKKSRKALSQ